MHIDRHRPLLAVVAIAAALTVVLGTVVWAHMKVVKSMPAADSIAAAPPGSIQVWFSQAPDVKVSKLDLTGPSGPVALTNFHAMDDRSIMATIAGSLPDGAYTVSWQAAGDDGHIQKGTYTFTVKRAAP